MGFKPGGNQSSPTFCFQTLKQFLASLELVSAGSCIPIQMLTYSMHQFPVTQLRKGLNRLTNQQKFITGNLPATLDNHCRLRFKGTWLMEERLICSASPYFYQNAELLFIAIRDKKKFHSGQGD